MGLPLTSWMILANVFFVAFLFYIPLSYFATYCASHGLTEVQIGFVYALQPLAQGSTSILLSLVTIPGVVHGGARHYGHLVNAGTMFAAGVNVLIGFVPDIVSPNMYVVVFATLRVLTGACLAVVEFSSFLLLQKTDMENFDVAVGWWEIIVGVSVIIAPPLGSLLYNFGSFEVPFVVGSLACCLSTAGLYLHLQKTLPPLAPKEQESEDTHADQDEEAKHKILWKLFTSNPAYLLGALCALCGQGSLAFFDSMAPLFFLEYYDVESGRMGLIQAYTAFAYSCSVPVVTQLSKRDILSKQSLLVLGSILIGISTIFLGPPDVFPRHWSFTFVAMNVFFLGFAATMVPLMPYMVESAMRMSPEGGVHDDKYREVGTAMCSSVGVLGFVPGSLLGSYFVRVLGFPTAFAVFGAMVVVMVGSARTVYEFQVVRKQGTGRGSQKFTELEEV